MNLPLQGVPAQGRDEKSFESSLGTSVHPSCTPALWCCAWGCWAIACPWEGFCELGGNPGDLQEALWNC